MYVQTFPATGGKWQVSTAGGVQPRWRRDGGELYYLAADGKIMAVEIDRKAASFDRGVPRPLFQTAIPGTALSTHFAATGDGQRFLLQALPEQSQSAITVVVNWTAGLGR